MARKPRVRGKELGIPAGTAWGRLRKLITFDLVKKLDENFCFRCGAEIPDARELSIEHKKPWEGMDPILFWDLENIAFSHLKCNSAHSRKPLKKVAPEGTSWCTICRRFLPVSEFWKSQAKGNRGGFVYRCKQCKNRKQNEERQRNGR